MRIEIYKPNNLIWKLYFLDPDININLLFIRIVGWF
jgi:hypothetical protein